VNVIASQTSDSACTRTERYQLNQNVDKRRTPGETATMLTTDNRELDEDKVNKTINPERIDDHGRTYQPLSIKQPQHSS
ncbi:Hypothetical protein HVR_LOCUS938, partial [uncultured virus]